MGAYGIKVVWKLLGTQVKLSMDCLGCIRNLRDGCNFCPSPSQVAILHRESKKTRHQTLGHNFTNYYPIFKIFSLADSVVNLQQIHV